jgi:hypothetical protein
MSEFLKPCSHLFLAHEQGFTSDALWCGRPGMRPMLGLRISAPSLTSDVPRALKGDDMASAILTLHFCSIHDLLFCPALQEWLAFSQVQIEHTFGKAMRLKESACPRCMAITTEALHKQLPKLFPASVPLKASGF